MKSFLFAYGTLQPKIAPEEVRRAVKLLRKVGEASAHGRLCDFGEFPGAIFDESEPGKIHGIVLRLPSAKALEQRVLHDVDAYEGVDAKNPSQGLFVRRKVPVALQNGKRLLCWAYEYNGPMDAGKRISSGVFRRPSRLGRRVRT